MIRSSGITASAVVAFLGSAAFLLLGFLFVSLSGRLPAGQIDPRILRLTAILCGLVLIGCGAWGISTAVGLLRLRERARISMLVFSALMAFVSVASALWTVAMQPPVQPGLTAAQYKALYLGIVAFYFVFCLLGALWLYYFSRASVKQQFAGGLVAAGQESQRPDKPVSILAIAWCLALTGPPTLFLIPLHFPTMFLGRAESGLPAALLYLVTGLLSFVLGLGMLRWKPWARTAAAWYFLFWFVHGMAQTLLPGWQERQAAFHNLMPRWAPETKVYVPSFPLWFSVVFNILVTLVPAYFLVSRKEAYLAVAKQTPRSET